MNKSERDLRDTINRNKKTMTDYIGPDLIYRLRTETLKTVADIIAQLIEEYGPDAVIDDVPGEQLEGVRREIRIRIDRLETDEEQARRIAVEERKRDAEIRQVQRDMEIAKAEFERKMKRLGIK